MFRQHLMQHLSLSKHCWHLWLQLFWIRFLIHIQQLRCCKFHRGWLILCWLHLWNLLRHWGWHQVGICCSILLQLQPWLLSKISSLSSRMGFLELHLRKLTQPIMLQSISFYLWELSTYSYLIKVIHFIKTDQFYMNSFYIIRIIFF